MSKYFINCCICNCKIETDIPSSKDDSICCALCQYGQDESEYYRIVAQGLEEDE